MAGGGQSQVIHLRSHQCERPRSNAISSSSRAKLEDMPRPSSIVDSTEDTVNLVGNVNADSARAYDSARQSFTEEHFHHHEPVTATNTVQQHGPFLEHAVHDIVPPAFPDSSCNTPIRCPCYRPTSLS
ncbi:hypothetical protein M378DRAFT_369885 [Amanita muscaria Koide BX008]|uniref:Uncharacterized protein n=1 Tax=Amanita muscaria (strain Koide BX008) TaxID=946122 RepID=A0A0C2XB84_AMAMK|nr:hypothetical protein M378DRAFT_369885 [Amanita muscaria Koide BX008]